MIRSSRTAIVICNSNIIVAGLMRLNTGIGFPVAP